jgi:sulfur-oxidizing protein SoxY
MFEKMVVPQAIDAERRQVLKSLGIAGLVGFGLAGPIGAGSALAADAPGWPHEAFEQKTLEDALKALYGKTFAPSDKIALDVPEIAENGAVVPVSVTTSLPGATSLAILTPNNPYTLTAFYKLAPGTSAAVSCRIKMAKTSKVVAVVESGGALYGASKEIKVTLGGCGG